MEDRDKGVEIQQNDAHCLHLIADYLESGEAASLAARELDARVGHHTKLLDPSAQGCPCDIFTNEDAQFMLSKAEELMNLLRPRFV